MDKSLKEDKLNKCGYDVGGSCYMKNPRYSFHKCDAHKNGYINYDLCRHKSSGDDQAENKCPDRFVHPQEHVISKRESFND